MRHLLYFLGLLAIVIAPSVHAYSTDNHTGSYIYVMGGLMNPAHDTNIRTNLKFGSNFAPGFGLTYGHNITDWIAPEIQFAYSTSRGNTPGGRAREHMLNIRLNAKYSFLTSQAMNQSGWKILPYAKAGGVVHALFVNAPVDDDKVGAYGGGFGLGAGLEVNYGVLYLGLDISNDLLFLQATHKTIAGVRTKIINGGFDYQLSVMGAVGVHF